jgi:glycine cleavage system H lipoate-binding protein
MRCPFLREEQVKSCQSSPFRKLIARSASSDQSERCTSPDHVRCPALQPSHEAHPDPSRCPFLRESLVQFCAASPAPSYVPWNDSPELRCGHDGHRFCDLFLAMSGPKGRRPAGIAAAIGKAETIVVEGIAMPSWLYYSPNHMWLDLGDDDIVHIGIDDFAARLLGAVDRLVFLPQKSSHYPTVVLTVRDADLTLVFSRALPLVNANTRLRFNPEAITADPYGKGWLFEARLPHGAAQKLQTQDLYFGDAARVWMRGETRRAAEAVHESILSQRGAALVADGGDIAADLLKHLERDEIVQLFAALFPLPMSTWRT